jgi:hypothetical protein
MERHLSFCRFIDGYRSNALRTVRVKTMMADSSCSLGAALHLVSLRALLPLNDIELDLVSLFETLVAIELNGAVVHEDVRPIVPANETIALRVVEPLHFSFVLGHVSVTSLQSRFERKRKYRRGCRHPFVFRSR